MNKNDSGILENTFVKNEKILKLFQNILKKFQKMVSKTS